MRADLRPTLAAFPFAIIEPWFWSLSGQSETRARNLKLGANLDPDVPVSILVNCSMTASNEPESKRMRKVKLLEKHCSLT